MKDFAASSREPKLNAPHDTPYKRVKMKKLFNIIIWVFAIIGVTVLRSPRNSPEYREKKVAKEQLSILIDTSYTLVQEYTQEQLPNVPESFFQKLENKNSFYLKQSIYNEVAGKIDSIYAIPKISKEDLTTEMTILVVSAGTKISIEILDSLKAGLLDDGYATKDELAQIFTEWQ